MKRFFPAHAVGNGGSKPPPYGTIPYSYPPHLLRRSSPQRRASRIERNLQNRIFASLHMIQSRRQISLRCLQGTPHPPLTRSPCLACGLGHTRDLTAINDTSSTASGPPSPTGEGKYSTPSCRYATQLGKVYVCRSPMRGSRCFASPFGFDCTAIRSG